MIQECNLPLAVTASLVDTFVHAAACRAVLNCSTLFSVSGAGFVLITAVVASEKECLGKGHSSTAACTNTTTRGVHQYKHAKAGVIQV